MFRNRLNEARIWLVTLRVGAMPLAENILPSTNV